jgi:antirestriction protein ArdC
MAKEQKNRNEIINVIKEKFVDLNSVKSIKQLDFYIKRNKTSADKLTIKKFEAFVKDNELSDIYNNALKVNSNDTSPDIVKRVKEIVRSIKIDVKKVKSNAVLEQVLAIYEKHIESFKNGEKFVYQQPWDVDQVIGHPRNVRTGVQYQAGNAYLLGLIQTELGLDLPFFMNKGDIEALNLELPVKKLVICNKVIELYVADNKAADHPEKWISAKKYKALNKKEQDFYSNQKIIKNFDLYHHSQFESGLSDHAHYQLLIKDFAETVLLNKLKSCKTVQERKSLFSPQIEAAKSYIQSTREQMGVSLIEHNKSCFYVPATDEIAMVSEQNFSGENGNLEFLGVLCHELSHSTGHHSRLKRAMCGQGGANKQNYGFEEIVAESSACQLLKQFNLPSVLDKDSAYYIHSWLKTQTGSNKDFLKIGCQMGQKSADFIVDKAYEYQNKIIQKIDIDLFIKQISSLTDETVSFDLIIQCHYINCKAQKLISKFLEEYFDGLTSFELLDITGGLLTDSAAQLNFTEVFNSYLINNVGIEVSVAEIAAKIANTHHTNNILNDDAELFKIKNIISQFNEKYGVNQIDNHLSHIELSGNKFKSAESIIKALASRTDKLHILEVDSINLPSVSKISL